MRFRKLRIAWSVVWGLLAVLLIVLWVRSHFVKEEVDHVTHTPIETSAFVVVSDNGTLYVLNRVAPTSTAKGFNLKNGWSYEWFPDAKTTVETFHFYHKRGEGFIIRFPTLIPVLLLAAIGIAPWWSDQFSLRTLLIATTLIAIVLGAIVYAVR